MKELLKKIAAVPVIVLSVMSCNKETAPETAAETSKISISVKAEIDNLAACEDTKASVAPAIRHSWENGDAVFVYDGKTPLCNLTVSIEDDSRYASLTADDIVSPSSTTLTCVYAPGLKKAPLPDEYGNVTIPMDKQNPTSTPFVVYGTIDADKVNTPGQIVKFQFATAVVLVNCLGLDASKAVTKAELSGINTNCVLTLSNSGAPSIGGSNVDTITSDGEFSSGNGKSFFYLGVPVSSEVSVNGDSRELAVTQGTDTYTTNFTNSKIVAGEFKNVLYALKIDETGGGEEPGEEPGEESDEEPDEYEMPAFGCDPGEYVEIGGILWAKNNLAVTASGKAAWKDKNGNEVKVPGKTYPVINGDYFQWAASYDGYGLTGENVKTEKLVIYSQFTSNGFTYWGDIKRFQTTKSKTGWGAPYSTGGSYYSKYSVQGTCLETTDDAANLCLGNGWRIPTMDDWDALIKKTYWVYDVSDKGFYVFSGKTGTAYNKYEDVDKSSAILFFPHTIYTDDLSFNTGNNSYYQTSTLYLTTQSKDVQMKVATTSSTLTLGFVNGFRYLGVPIRPVKNKTD